MVSVNDFFSEEEIEECDRWLAELCKDNEQISDETKRLIVERLADKLAAAGYFEKSADGRYRRTVLN